MGDYSMEVGPVGNPNATLGPDEFEQLNPIRGHTGKSDFRATVRWNPDLSDLVLDRVRIYDGSTLLFRGFLKNIDYSEEALTTNLGGPGIETTLADFAAGTSYQYIQVADAIQDYVNNHATDENGDPLIDEFDLTRGNPSIVSNDSLTLDAGDGGFQGLDEVITIASDVPATVSAVSLKLTPQVYGNSEDGFGGLYDVVADSPGQNYYHIDAEYADFDASNGGSVNITETIDHDIPADRVGAIIHGIQTGSGDVTGSYVKLNGTELSTLPNGAGRIEDPTGDYQAFYIYEDEYASNGGSDISAGDSVKFEFLLDTGDPNNTDVEWEVDYMAIYDTKYAPNNWDEPTSFDEEITAPTNYPEGIQVEIENQRENYNVREGRVESTWNDTSNGQQLSQSLDGSNHLTAQNTDTQTADFDGDGQYGYTIKPRVTLAGYGSNAWLSQKANAQELTRYKLYFTSDDTPIFEDKTVNSNHLQNLIDLHNAFRFVVDHNAEDSNGNLIFRLESFPTGTDADDPTPDWAVVDRDPTIDYSRYRNKVTIKGPKDDQGNRPQTTIQDNDEINQFGEQPIELIKTNTSNNSERGQVAFAELQERLSQAQEKGTLAIVPLALLPGYSYEVDWFNDGNPVSTPSERLNYQIRKNQLIANLEFNPPKNTDREILTLRDDTEDLKESL